MIHPHILVDFLSRKGIDFYCGVPDSLLKSLCAWLSDHLPPEKYCITANEGTAIGLATGVYLATGAPGVVFMQNSGQGNAINPLISLADPKVYGIPLLLIIGWRGEPGIHDEPQHVKQGEMTLALLETLGIAYDILPDNERDVCRTLERAVESLRHRSAPYALIVRKNTFEPYSLEKSIASTESAPELSREEAIQIVLQYTNRSTDKSVFVSTTGMISREVFENRVKMGGNGESDFLTVGSMGHASSIAMGIALSKKDTRVWCLDGDGALLMHMGTLAVLGTSGVRSYKHILFNNGAHDSVGGQPTCGFFVDFCSVARACGYKKVFFAQKADEVRDALNEMTSDDSLAFCEIRVRKGARANLGRPDSTPQRNKVKFMDFLRSQ